MERRGEIVLPRDRNNHRRLSPRDVDALRRIVYGARKHASPDPA
jgi:hypothetical protein